MRALLPVLQVLLVIIIVAWDIILSARIAQVRKLPRPFVFLTALSGFLLLPALFIHLATSEAITARSVTAVAWIWPLTLVIFALQALYAAARRLVNPFLGFFMSAYDVLIAVDVVLRFLAAEGRPLPTAALTFLAATAGAFAFVTQSPEMIASPAFLFVPMAAPAFPALRAWSASFRFFLAVVAFLWIAVLVSQAPPAYETVKSYINHDPSTERLQERPASDLEIGIKIFPDLAGGPPPSAIKNDLALVDTLGVAVVSITIIPEQINKAGLDSIAHTLEVLRGDSTQLIVTLGYVTSLNPLPGRTFDEAKRLASIEEIVRILRPDILVPALDPYGAGALSTGSRPPDFWRNYLTRASAEAKRARPRTRVGVAASTYDSRDSTLYAWAAAPGSPVDVVGFSLWPSAAGLRTLDAARGAADRWMRESKSTKDHWVFSTGGYPGAHGEASQEQAVWDALAWSTSRPLIKGLIVAEAGDYSSVRGIRAADGHLRAVAFAIKRAIKGLQESAAPDSTPAALPKSRARVGR
ncbi:MAG: hypothetical protein M3Z05_10235 [Gemmatimonadota bacterium]|nr:hypothetical protein [Gemmatimonadota bacterium]